jgi:hypothetical protein
MPSNTQTYETPSAVRLDALAIDAKNKSNERLDADCAYLLNVFNQTLSESFKDPSKVNHSVDIDCSKLNNYIRITNCVGTPHDILAQMKSAGVKVNQCEYITGHLKYTYYHKIDKTLNLYL